jgi:predicted membrane protein
MKEVNMRNKVQIVFGGTVLLIGVIIILGVLFDINLWAICLPIGLILIGVWILVRPRFLPDDSDLNIRIFGDVRRKGSWSVTDQENWLFIGDIRYDMTSAQIPDGETNMRVIAFIGDIRLKVPADVGVKLSSMAFLNETRIEGKKRDNFLVPVDYQSESYDTAVRKISLETVCFIGDIRLEHQAVETQETNADEESAS